jgi:hypothetical protein
MRFFILVLIASACLVACVPVDGGAIEASWVLRSFDGRAISSCRCSQPEIARIRFIVAAVVPGGGLGEDVCAGRSDCEFSCARQSGVTRFFVPAARYAISVAPLGVGGEALAGEPPRGSGVRVPAPILRDVVFGRPTQLDALAIESGCAAACNGDDGNRVCTRE